MAVPMTHAAALFGCRSHAATRVELHEHVRQPVLVENARAQAALHTRFGPSCGHDDQRQGLVAC